MLPNYHVLGSLPELIAPAMPAF